MTDTNLPLTADADLDDLPRTLRREHEARRKRDAAPGDPPRLVSRDGGYSGPVLPMDDPPPATVTRIDVPFLRLMFFFLKAVVAAIPALILLTAILWAGGQLVERYYPELIKMRILITFPG